MKPHAQPPATPPASRHRPSRSYDFSIELFQPGQQPRASTSPSIERHDVEAPRGLPSGDWLRFSMPWPTCGGIMDDSDGSQRCDRNTESPLSRPRLTQGMQVASPPDLNLNSTQPTHHPAMVVMQMEQKREADRIRGGLPECCLRFRIATPQNNDRGIQIPKMQNNQTQSAGTRGPEGLARDPTSEGMAQLPSNGPSRSRVESSPIVQPGQGNTAVPRSRRPSQAAEGRRLTFERATGGKWPAIEGTINITSNAIESKFSASPTRFLATEAALNATNAPTGQ